MEKIVSLLSDLFDALDGIESPLLICELILTAVMTHRLRQVKNNNPISSTSSQDPVTPSTTSTVPTTSIKNASQAKKQLKDQLMLDLDLVFSDKPDSELSEDEVARVDRMLRYVEDMKK